MNARNDGNGAGAAKAPTGSAAAFIAGSISAAATALQCGKAAARRTANRIAGAVEQRTAVVSGEAACVATQQAWPVSEQPTVTVVFDDDREFVRFTDYVYKLCDGRGLGFTDVPVPRAVQLTPGLLKATRGQFEMRVATPDELARVRARLSGRSPFAEETLDEFFGSAQGHEQPSQ